MDITEQLNQSVDQFVSSKEGWSTGEQLLAASRMQTALQTIEHLRNKLKKIEEKALQAGFTVE